MADRNSTSVSFLLFRLTVAMMSRITINLKKSAHKVHDSSVRPEMPTMFGQKSRSETNSGIHVVAPRFSRPARFNLKSHTDSAWEIDETEGQPGSFPMIRLQNPTPKSNLNTGAVEIQTYESLEDPYPVVKGDGRD
ncbi:hypothetical protein CC2G_013131 [Coprinopsis cinerea AmutBmut pab1-1]|nr:hypothetical protein CC2G_013131 [Coprinopsis cinerea AmutBmut pab1-1]